MTSHVLLERSFDPPLSVGDVYDSAKAARSCFEMHRVDWRGSFLATGGRSMVCWFVAPDAESARIAMRQAHMDTRRVWSGTLHEGPDPADPNVIVERSFDAPVALETVQAIEDAGGWCLEAHRVRFARTFFSTDRRRMLCLYQAPDAESVRLAQQQAGMPLEAVWSFTRVAPPG